MTQLVELQRNLDTFERNGIELFAVSYDSQDVLHDFAAKHRITYPLLSDNGSTVIRDFGILNTGIPNDHRWYGVPYPGVYMVGKDGLVFDKSFVARHGLRESANDMLQESFQVEHLDRGQVQVVTTPHLTATAYFAAPTVRPNQLTVLTVEISIVDGIHINARSLPEGYTPVELTLDTGGGLALERVAYPEPEALFLQPLNETLPVYKDEARIKAHCRSVSRGQAETLHVTARLTYQACDDRECYLPQALTLTLPLERLPPDSPPKIVGMAFVGLQQVWGVNRGVDRALRGVSERIGNG